MTKLSEKRLFLLDMDGTIYLSQTLFDGTLDFLRHVRERGGRYLFLTNNSSPEQTPTSKSSREWALRPRRRIS